MIRYVGLDVHKRVVEACVVDAQGKVVLRHRFALDRRTLELFAKKFLRQTDRAALEATTNCWIVAELLKLHVAEVVISNPMVTKAIAQAKIKTDKVDAHVLAQLLRCDFLPRVWQPDEATRRLRELTSRRSTLVAERTAARNRIHSVLAMRLVVPPVKDMFRTEGIEWLRTAALDEQARQLVNSDLRLFEFVRKEIELVEEELARHGYADKSVKLLMTLPCVDVTTAEAMMAAWGDPKRFADGAHAASYLGLVPSTRQSAEHCYHGPITKQGNSLARWTLIEAAQHLDKNPGPLGCFFRRLLRKKNRNVAVVAVARKLATIGWQMVIAGEPYRYAMPESTQQKLSRLRIRATGQRRKSGLPKGQKAVAKLPGGGRSIHSLAEICQSENLPTPQALAPGEHRMIGERGCTAFVEKIGRSQVVPLRRAHNGKSYAKTSVRHN
jgi:transposase